MVYNVARNSIGTVPNAPLDSAPGKELRNPIIEHASDIWRTG